jgi:uncharacterized membrane protein
VVYLTCVRRDRQDPRLRFPSIQCLLLFAPLGPLLNLNSQHISKIADAASAVLILEWLVAMTQAGRGKLSKLPGLGQMAEPFAPSAKSTPQ